MRAISVSDHPLRRYRHSKLSKMAVGRHLGFDVTRNSAIRSTDPENPTLEPNMTCIVRITRCADTVIRNFQDGGRSSERQKVLAYLHSMHRAENVCDKGTPFAFSIFWNYFAVTVVGLLSTTMQKLRFLTTGLLNRSFVDLAHLASTRDR